jgi:hypothetical protein
MFTGMQSQYSTLPQHPHLTRGALGLLSTVIAGQHMSQERNSSGAMKYEVEQLMLTTHAHRDTVPISASHLHGFKMYGLYNAC